MKSRTAEIQSAFAKSDWSSDGTISVIALNHVWTLVRVNDVVKATISYNDITSPLRPWAVKIAGRRELHFSSLNGVIKGRWWKLLK